MVSGPCLSWTYLVLNKSKWHTPCVTSNLDIASAVLEECNVHMMLKLIIRLCLHKTLHCQRCVSMEVHLSLLCDEDTSSWR